MYIRGITDSFIQDLKSGCLKFFLNEALTNDNICLEIRKNYINLYYRGGNALKIEQKKRGGYRFFVDPKYCKNKGNEINYDCLTELNRKNELQDFIGAFPVILAEMDSWFACHPKKERDFQHRLIKSNQTSPVIVDIEYAGRTSGKRLFRLDMIGLVPGNNTYKLIVFENKFGTGAISGTAGIKKHYDDIADILKNDSSRNNLIESAATIAKNKYELGILDFNISIQDIKEIEILFLLAGYNPKSTSIRGEVKNIDASVPAKLLMADENNLSINYENAEDLFIYGY